MYIQEEPYLSLSEIKITHSTLCFESSLCKILCDISDFRNLVQSQSTKMMTVITHLTNRISLIHPTHLHLLLHLMIVRQMKKKREKEAEEEKKKKKPQNLKRPSLNSILLQVKRLKKINVTL